MDGGGAAAAVAGGVVTVAEADDIDNVKVGVGEVRGVTKTIVFIVSAAIPCCCQYDGFWFIPF